MLLALLSLPPQHNIEETYTTTHCRPVNLDSFFMFFLLIPKLGTHDK